MATSDEHKRAADRRAAAYHDLVERAGHHREASDDSLVVRGGATRSEAAHGDLPVSLAYCPPRMKHRLTGAVGQDRPARTPVRAVGHRESRGSTIRDLADVERWLANYGR